MFLALLSFVSVAQCLTLDSFDNFTSITVDWTQVVRVSQTTTTTQIVVTPLMTRTSRIHDIAWKHFKNLNAKHVRFQTWFTYPHLVVPQLTPPSGPNKCGHLEGNSNNGNWNLTLKCPINHVMMNFTFASWGTPTGQCGNFEMGKCHATTSMSAIRSQCERKQSCIIASTAKFFGKDPCPGTKKQLSVQCQCVSVLDGSVYQNANWDFERMDELMEDFWANSGPEPVMDIATFPSWMEQGVEGSSLYNQVPDSPFISAWGYENGNNLRDPTARQVGEWFGKIVSHYVNGKFEDEYGNVHESNLRYPMKFFEILNEPEAEHHTNVQTYTKIYDQTVMAMRDAFPPSERDSLNFMGMSLQYHNEWDWYTYFLNHSNHEPNVPLDYISFHNYISEGKPGSPNLYEQLFPETDQFVAEIDHVLSIRDALSPNTKIDLDEIGILYSEPKTWPFPMKDFLAGSAYFAYLFGKVAVRGVDILGVSQFMGTPNMNSTQFPSPGGLNENWLVGTMIDPFSGEPNARYWGLKLLIDHFQPGDQLVKTMSSNDTNAFALGAMDGVSKKKKVLLVNKRNAVMKMMLSDVLPQKSDMFWVDDNTAVKYGIVSSVTIALNPLAVAVVYLDGFY